MDNATKKFIEEQTEKLAIMVAQGFASTATKQDLGQEVSDLRIEMNEHFEKVEERLETIDERLASMETTTGRHYKDIDDIQSRTHVLETRVDRLEVVHQ